MRATVEERELDYVTGVLMDDAAEYGMYVCGWEGAVKVELAGEAELEHLFLYEPTLTRRGGASVVGVTDREATLPEDTQALAAYGAATLHCAREERNGLAGPTADEVYDIDAL